MVVVLESRSRSDCPVHCLIKLQVYILHHNTTPIQSCGKANLLSLPVVHRHLLNLQHSPMNSVLLELVPSLAPLLKPSFSCPAFAAFNSLRCTGHLLPPLRTALFLPTDQHQADRRPSRSTRIETSRRTQQDFISHVSPIVLACIYFRNTQKSQEAPC